MSLARIDEHIRQMVSPLHRSPCHSQHTCPSDHHTYVWNGLSCTSYPDERLANDRIVVRSVGLVFYCHHASGGGGGR